MNTSSGIVIPLDIPDVRVVDCRMDASQNYVITIESTQEGTPCRQCGRVTTQLHARDDWIVLRHLPILGHAVYLRLQPKRYICQYCDGRPTTTQRLSWYEPRSPNTRVYEDYLLLRLVNSTLGDVQMKEDVTSDVLLGIIDRRLSMEVDWEEITEIVTLGMDEISLRKGHRSFIVIITSRRASGEIKLLATLPDRKKETAAAFLDSIPDRLKPTVKEACIDLYEGYRSAVQETLPGVEVVADRFHVSREYREVVDTLRKQELKELKARLPEEQYKEIKGAMWILRKRPENLTEEEALVLQRLFGYSPALEQAYQFREELTNIFEQPLSKRAAIQEIEAWQERVRKSGLKCYGTFLGTLDNWKDEITNYFNAHHSSGFVEGLNNKIKVLKRRCYGIFNIGHIFQRLSLDLYGYQQFARSGFS